MATLITALTESASLTEKEYIPVPPYSEEGGAVTDYQGEVRLTLPQVRRVPDWVGPTVESFVRIMQLPPNWDSYGAEPIPSAVIERAVEVLSHVMEDNSPHPSIVALSEGGLQMEWHLRDQDVEIVVSTDEPPSFYYRDQEGSAEEGLPSAAYAHLRSIIQALG